MRTSKLLFSSLLLLLAICEQPTAAAEILEKQSYRRTFGSETTIMNWQRLPGRPELIIATIDSETDQTEIDENFETRKWWVKDEQKQTDIRIERQGKQLKISGIFEGNRIDRQDKVDDDPWFQTMSISFRPFLRSGDTSIKFWFVRPDTLASYKLRAVKQGVEEISLQGHKVKVKAEKLELRLAGLGAPFWKAHYWFRNSDGLFLRYVGPGGLPGGPNIHVELVAKKLFNSSGGHASLKHANVLDGH